MSKNNKIYGQRVSLKEAEDCDSIVDKAREIENVNTKSEAFVRVFKHYEYTKISNVLIPEVITSEEKDIVNTCALGFLKHIVTNKTNGQRLAHCTRELFTKGRVFMLADGKDKSSIIKLCKDSCPRSYELDLAKKERKDATIILKELGNQMVELELHRCSHHSKREIAFNVLRGGRGTLKCPLNRNKAVNILMNCIKKECRYLQIKTIPIYLGDIKQYRETLKQLENKT